MTKHLTWLAAVGWLIAANPALAAPTQTPGEGTGYRLLSELVGLVNSAAKGSVDTGAASAGLLKLAKDVKAARDSQSVDAMFAVRYSRLLSALRQGLLADPGLLYWPMYRHAMVDFIEERTGQLPDWNKLLFVVNDHGGSGVGLAMLVEAVMSEVVSLHLHLETLDRRPAILQGYLERAQKAGGPVR
jgi:phage tail protein X